MENPNTYVFFSLLKNRPSFNWFGWKDKIVHAFGTTYSVDEVTVPLEFWYLLTLFHDIILKNITGLPKS